MSSRTNLAEKPPMTPTESPRTVLSGRPEGDVFVIVLDGGQEVETTDRGVFESCAEAKREGRRVIPTLELVDGGRPRIIDLDVVLSTRPPAMTTAVARPEPRPQALAKAPELPHGLIMRPEELAAQMTAMAAHYNVLSPAIAVAEMAPGYGANLAVVQIDPAVTLDADRKSGVGPDCYWSRSLFRDENKRALNKQGLLKIAQAAGIQWDRRFCRRTDDGRERYLWRWEYAGWLRTHDGQLAPVQGSRELDLRDGSPEAAGMSTNQLTKARASGNEACETKAMQRAIRTLGIRQVYTVDELRKPFLIVRFSFTPDMEDPEIKKLVTERAIAGIGALYPSAEPALLPPPREQDDIDAAMPTISEAARTAERQPKPIPQAAATDDAPLPVGQALIEKVEKFSGTNPTTKRGWTRYQVTFSTGEVAATFSHTLQALIDDAHAQKAPVKYTTEENEGYEDKLATLEIVDRRQQALPIGNEPPGGF